MSKFAARCAAWATRTYTRSATYSSKKFPVFKKYALVELTPPTPVDVGKAFGQAVALSQKAASGGWKDLTVYKAMLGALICWESFMWFFAGEVIGRRCLRGYNIEGAYYGVFKPVYTHNDSIGMDVWDLKTEAVE